MRKINLLFVTLLTVLSLSLASCGGNDPELPWTPEPDQPGKPEKPDKPEQPDKPVIKEAKPRYVWIDAAGNFEQFANSQENIKADLKKIKDAGFTDIVVDVRPTTGDILYQSSYGDPVTKMDVWTKHGYDWVDRTATFDYLQTFVDEGHELGLKVNVSFNTFVGGYLCPYALGSTGMLFRDSSKKKWATVVNTSSGLTNTMDMLNYSEDYGAKFLNPANDEVQEYICNLLADLAKYDIDGIILDRCRYSDDQLMSDFSPESRTKFERFIGQSVSNFPSDIMSPGSSSISRPGDLTKKWLSFRVKVIHDFVVKARKKIKDVNPKIRFGVYVGAWYSTYYGEGVNWASPKYDASSEYSWANPDYSTYGYADHLDFIFLGAYAGVDNIYGDYDWSIQGFCKNGGARLMGDVPFAGGPDIGNATGWDNGGQASRIPMAIDACINSCDGGMFIFDLCHIRMYNYWSACQKGFNDYLKTLN